jgi:membrane-bound transcription factor site-1 protease
MVTHWFLTPAPCRAEPLDAAQLVTEYRPHASVIPPTLDLSPCQPTGAPVLGDGYMWPLCAQPLYHGALPALVNLTVLNGMARVSSFSRAPVFSTSIAAHASLLEISFEHQQLLWPWGGTLGVALRPTSAAAAFEGLIHGVITFELKAVGGLNAGATSAVSVPVVAHVVPTPARHRRLLWDQVCLHLMVPLRTMLMCVDGPSDDFSDVSDGPSRWPPSDGPVEDPSESLSDHRSCR